MSIIIILWLAWDRQQRCGRNLVILKANLSTIIIITIVYLYSVNS